MKSKNTIKQGLSVAAGVFTGNAILVPILFGIGFRRGIVVGFIAAYFVLSVYALIAACQSDKPCETEGKNKNKV